MNTEFFNALDLLEKERGIPKAYMLERVEAALVSAFKKDSGGGTNVRVVVDESNPWSLVQRIAFFSGHSAAHASTTS